MLWKTIEKDFLALEKIFLWLKIHFPSISHVNVCFFSSGQNFLPGQKSFVQADGPGINELVNYKAGHMFSTILLSFKFSSPFQKNSENNYDI